MIDEPVSGFRLDLDLVGAFVDGRLNDAGVAELADQVAMLMPFHASMPIALVATLQRVEHRLGGEAEMLAWLDRHPGRPRMTTRSYGVIALLDEVGGLRPVVTALRELRAREPDPPGLAPFLIPDTTSATLPSVAQGIESLLGDDRPAEAVGVAVEAAEWVGRLAPRAAELDAELADLGERAERAAAAAREAVPETSAGGPPGDAGDGRAAPGDAIGADTPAASGEPRRDR
ncbi:hypothetical protein ACVGVM_07250 [Pseudonocardia bannensis]|uniref:Uncharacterized protein n=1 Tax=Pseudonocardia bannensis TaxID=630973 RepID=A0A848DK50_9PSEU|nr:hypothetical protein [Pseudonocardia bannensis]NMH92929.1 hypothetical protein [Pseudonocardia bannensis]